MPGLGCSTRGALVFLVVCSQLQHVRCITSSPTWDQTSAPCVGNTPVDHQGSPCKIRSTLKKSVIEIYCISIIKKSQLASFMVSNDYLLQSFVSCSVLSIVSVLSRLFETPQTVAHQASLSMEFSRQEYWSGCHAFLQGIFPTQGLNPSLLCQRHLGSPILFYFTQNSVFPSGTDIQRT